MSHDPYRALYLHIPFCKQRCLYCDFITNAVRSDDRIVSNYVENMVLEIRKAAKRGDLSKVQTVYLGGGTPSYVGQKHLTEILYMLGLSMSLTEDVEVSMEANPDSMSEALVKDLWALGVNRLSIGVQSFDDDLLEFLGRVHDSHAAMRAIEVAQVRFQNVSVDLICGIPGQTIRGFLKDVEQALDAGVKHVSVYPLTVEPGTPLAKLVRKGKVPNVDEDLQADMMQAAADLLKGRGLHRYEVASYAYPGFECRHNIAYLTGVPYLGLGHSAVTMTQNDEHRMRVQDGQVIEDLNARQMAAEDLMLGMRMSCGVSDETVTRCNALIPNLLDVLGSLQERGLVIREDGRWRPTERGWLCGNELYGTLLDLED